MPPLRIASLLPSATEILFALDLGDRVVGVSHECDTPEAARSLPVLTQTSIDCSASSAEIDRQVRVHRTRGLSLYEIDEAMLAQVSPDLIVTQDTCDVCAVSFAEVRHATARLLGKAAEIVSLAPFTLADVLADIRRVGDKAGAAAKAEALIHRLSRRLRALGELTRECRPVRVLALEWLDPPMVAGHWTPELIRLAGGAPILATDGAPAAVTTWEAIAAAEPELILLIPCGFSLERTLGELATLYDRGDFAALDAVRRGRVIAIDGNAYFNRPGPRLVDSAALAAAAIHPDRCRTLARQVGATAAQIHVRDGKPAPCAVG